MITWACVNRGMDYGQLHGEVLNFTGERVIRQAASLRPVVRADLGGDSIQTVLFASRGIPGSPTSNSWIGEKQVSKLTVNILQSGHPVIDMLQQGLKSGSNQDSFKDTSAISSVTDYHMVNKTKHIYAFTYSGQYRFCEFNTTDNKGSIVVPDAVKTMGTVIHDDVLYFANHSDRKLGCYHLKHHKFQSAINGSLRIKHIVDYRYDAMSNVIRLAHDCIYFIENRKDNSWMLARYLIKQKVFESIQLDVGSKLESFDVVDRSIYTLDISGILSVISIHRSTNKLTIEHKYDPNQPVPAMNNPGGNLKPKKLETQKSAEQFSCVLAAGPYLLVRRTTAISLLNRSKLVKLDRYAIKSSSPASTDNSGQLKLIKRGPNKPSFVLSYSVSQASGQANMFSVFNLAHCKLSPLLDRLSIGLEVIYDIKQLSDYSVLIYGRGHASTKGFSGCYALQFEYSM